jgi:ribosomal protein L7/L12
LAAGENMQKVKIIGWEQGLKKISLTKLLQESAGKDLAEAKAMVDALIEGQPFEISFQQDADARAFLEGAKRLGAKVDLRNT